MIVKNMIALISLCILMSCTIQRQRSDCYDVNQGKLVVHANLLPYLYINNELRLGVSYREKDQFDWPKEIQDTLTVDNWVIADFHVCAVQGQQDPFYTGIKERVSIKSVSNMRVEDPGLYP